MGFVIVTSLECERCGPDMQLILDPDDENLAICPECELVLELEF